MHRLMGLLLILFVMVGMADAGEWVTMRVGGGEVGNAHSLQIDSSDNPHIAYIWWRNLYTIRLKYASYDGTTWRNETVAQLDPYGPATASLALDTDGYPHIAYDGYGGQFLKYARWDGTDWQIETIDEAWSNISGISLALSSENYPRVSYKSSQDGLKFAYWNGSSWQVDTIDSEDIIGSSSLVLDTTGIPHIAYHVYPDTGLKYASWSSSGWQFEEIDVSGRCGYNSLAMDSADNPHIAYYDDVNEDLKYVHWSGSEWVIEVVDFEGNVGGGASLELDSFGNPCILYRDKTNSYAKYASWNGSSWNFNVLDFPEEVGACTLALDSINNPHVSYVDTIYTGRALWYAYWEGGAAVDDLSLSAEATDDGVLLSWSIVGDEPASVSVLRAVNENLPVIQSGELSGSAASWLDVSAEAGVEYAYYLEVTELDGTVSRFGPSEVVVPGTVSELTLSDPYPNPASSALTISYELAVDGIVSLSVYDLSGRLVETLVSGEQAAGRHSVSWDSSASTMATGVYLIRLEVDGEAITKRAVISR